jgi:hypothetical protein
MNWREASVLRKNDVSSRQASEEIRAASLARDVVRGLKRRMVYTNGLKISNKRAQCSFTGVTEAMLKIAFGVHGAACFSITGSDLTGITGVAMSKPLRWGSSLQLASPVSLQLAGSTLTATATFGLARGGGGGGGCHGGGRGWT